MGYILHKNFGDISHKINVRKTKNVGNVDKSLLISKLFIYYFFRNIDVSFEIRFKKVEFGLY